MKRINVTFFWLLISSSYGWAQMGETDFREDLQFGIKIGANYSNVYSTNGDEFNPKGKLGFATGLFASLPITKYIGIQPELLYSEKGFKATGKVLGNTYDMTRTSSYIDVPLFLTLKPSEFFTLMVGPQYSYLIKQTNAYTNTTTSIETEQEFENESTRNHTFCFVGGFDVNVGHIVIGPRIGIDALKNNFNDNLTTPRYKNLWIQGTVGYRFY